LCMLSEVLPILAEIRLCGLIKTDHTRAQQALDICLEEQKANSFIVTATQQLVYALALARAQATRFSGAGLESVMELVTPLLKSTQTELASHQSQPNTSISQSSSPSTRTTKSSSLRAVQTFIHSLCVQISSLDLSQLALSFTRSVSPLTILRVLSPLAACGSFGRAEVARVLFALREAKHAAEAASQQSQRDRDRTLTIHNSNNVSSLATRLHIDVEELCNYLDDHLMAAEDPEAIPEHHSLLANITELRNQLLYAS